MTNVGSTAATYTAAMTGLRRRSRGGQPVVADAGAGRDAVFTVKFTRTTAALNAYVRRPADVDDGTHNVRIPMVIRPVALAAPAQVGTAARSRTT